MRKALSLIEVLVAVTIFSALSVSMYMFLHTGIRVREKIETQSSYLQGMYLNLETLAKELRNSIIFKPEDEASPVFRGDHEYMEFHTVTFDYAAGIPKISKLTYRFQDGALVKTIGDPLKEEVTGPFVFIEGLERAAFYYFDEKEVEEDSEWKKDWSDYQDRFPRGIRLELTYADKKGKETTLNKYVFIYRDDKEDR